MDKEKTKVVIGVYCPTCQKVHGLVWRLEGSTLKCALCESLIPISPATTTNWCAKCRRPIFNVFHGYCPDCGEPVCGGLPHCEACNTVIVGAKYCPKCGRSVDWKSFSYTDVGGWKVKGGKA